MENIYFPKQVVLSKWIGRKMSCMKNIFFKMLFFKSKGKWHKSSHWLWQRILMGSGCILEKLTLTYKQKQRFSKRDMYRKPWRFHICKMKVKGKTNCLPDNQMSERVSHWKLTRWAFPSCSQSGCKQRDWDEIINKSSPCRYFSKIP